MTSIAFYQYAELSALRSAGLLGDLGWGVIPLDIRPPDNSRRTSTKGAVAGTFPKSDQRSLRGNQNDDSFGSNTSNSSSSANDVEKRELQQEVKRLAQERSFLLKRLQESNKDLLRRAEGIRVFFENDLRKSKLREERLRSQVNGTSVSVCISACAVVYVPVSV
jgi:hypothetical protein